MVEVKLQKYEDSQEKGKRKKKLKLVWKLKITLDFIFCFRTEWRNILGSFIIMSELFPPKSSDPFFCWNYLHKWLLTSVWNGFKLTGPYHLNRRKINWILTWEHVLGWLQMHLSSSCLDVSCLRTWA